MLVVRLDGTFGSSAYRYTDAFLRVFKDKAKRIVSNRDEYFLLIALL